MRVPCGIVAGLVALAACGSSAGMPSRTSGPARCGPAGARTLAANSQVRVYSAGGAVYGCAAGAHQSHRLGASARSIREGRVGPIALAGQDAAYGLASYGVDTVSASVIVRRLSDGEQLRSAPATRKPVGPEFMQSVAAVVVKPDGAVAWIGEGGSVISGRTRDIEVGRADARGVALLDSGTGIDARSLRLQGSSVTWRHSGQTRSASLQ